MNAVNAAQKEVARQLAQLGVEVNDKVIDNLIDSITNEVLIYTPV